MDAFEKWWKADAELMPKWVRDQARLAFLAGRAAGLEEAAAYTEEAYVDGEDHDLGKAIRSLITESPK